MKGEGAMGRRYREFSRAVIPGMREELVADTSVLIDGKKVVHRVHSQTTQAYKDVPLTGNPVEDTIAILDARKIVSAHDKIDRRPKPVPKPTRRELSQAEVLASCPMCGGDGYITDEDGYEQACGCRR
jgi:hypothetical protein